jgi:hypothetical protein
MMGMHDKLIVISAQATPCHPSAGPANNTKLSHYVIPAQAGIQVFKKLNPSSSYHPQFIFSYMHSQKNWIPACAGMTRMWSLGFE